MSKVSSENRTNGLPQGRFLSCFFHTKPTALRLYTYKVILGIEEIALIYLGIYTYVCVLCVCVGNNFQRAHKF